MNSCLKLSLNHDNGFKQEHGKWDVGLAEVLQWVKC